MCDARAQRPTTPGLPPDDFPEPGAPTMNLLDDDADDAPTLGKAATRADFLRPVWSSTRSGAPANTVRYEVTGRTYADLRQTATDVLAALLGEETLPDGAQITLEVEPDTNELGSETPVSWRAEVTAEIAEPRRT